MIPAWALLPEDLRALGHTGDPAHLYARIFRGASWVDGHPAVGREARALLDRALDLSLPRIVDARTSVDGATKVLLAATARAWKRSTCRAR